MIKVSLITVCFNSDKYLKSAIESVKMQKYSEIEYIIIDGCSKDGTMDIIKEYELQFNNRLKWTSEPDKGIYDALNKGVALATGDIIGFLHSDDLFNSQDTLQHIAHAFKDDDISAVYGDLVFVDQQDINKIVRNWKSQSFKPGLLQHGWMPPHPTLFMRREVYEKHGFFNTNLKCAADYDYILRVFRDPTLTFEYLPEVITKMRVGGVSTKGIKNIINKKKEDYWVLKNNKMPYPLWLLFTKNVLKIPQLFFRKKRV